MRKSNFTRNVYPAVKTKVSRNYKIADFQKALCRKHKGFLNKPTRKNPNGLLPVNHQKQQNGL